MATNPKSVKRREREREQMRENILDSAMNIIVAEGYDAVSIRRIADDVSYTPGAIYSYFADKEEIIFTLAVRAAQSFNQAFQALRFIADPLERLHAIGRAYLHFAIEHKDSYDLMFIMSAPIEKMTKEGFKEGGEVFAFLRATVAECMERKYLPQSDADFAAFAMWSFVHGIASLFIRQRMTMIPEDKYQDLIEGTFHFLMRSMSPARYGDEPKIAQAISNVVAKDAT
jgi:AcrR family transcriptional regulator